MLWLVRPSKKHFHRSPYKFKTTLWKLDSEVCVMVLTVLKQNTWFYDISFKNVFFVCVFVKRMWFWDPEHKGSLSLKGMRVKLSPCKSGLLLLIGQPKLTLMLSQPLRMLFSSLSHHCCFLFSILSCHPVAAGLVNAIAREKRTGWWCYVRIWQGTLSVVLLLQVSWWSNSFWLCWRSDMST